MDDWKKPVSWKLERTDLQESVESLTRTVFFKTELNKEETRWRLLSQYT